MNHVILSDTVRTQLFDFICKSANEVSHTCWHSCKHRRGFSSREGHQDFLATFSYRWVIKPMSCATLKTGDNEDDFHEDTEEASWYFGATNTLGTIYLYIWDFRKGQKNMVQRMSLGLYPSTPQPFRESFVKMWNCWISKCWGVALIVFSSRLSPLLLSLQLRQFAFVGAFPAGSQHLLHRVFKAKHATRVAGCMTVCDATWHTGGLPDTMAFFHPTALAGQSSQRAESQEAETQEDLRMCFQDMKSSIFLLCHLSLVIFASFAIIFDPNITFETSPYCKIHTVEWFLSLECTQPLQEPQGLRYRGNLLPTHCPTSCDPVSFEKTIRQCEHFHRR